MSDWNDRSAGSGRSSKIQRLPVIRNDSIRGMYIPTVVRLCSPASNRRIRRIRRIRLQSLDPFESLDCLCQSISNARRIEEYEIKAMFLVSVRFNGFMICTVRKIAFTFFGAPASAHSSFAPFDGCFPTKHSCIPQYFKDHHRIERQQYNEDVNIPCGILIFLLSTAGLSGRMPDDCHKQQPLQ